MKLIRYSHDGETRIGALKEQGVIDLVAAGAPWRSIREIIEGGEDALAALKNIVASAKPVLTLDAVKLLPPIERPGKYLAIGMNYAKHLEEADKLGIARSKHQVWFNKQTTCIIGPYDEIEQGVTEKLDYEVELVAVIGKPAKGVTESEAPAHIFGYCVGNDVSARDWQFHSPTFTMGKSFDTHGPIGPWIVTADEIADPHALRLRSWVNGELRQDNNTANMIHNLWAQISYLSTAFTLESGDLIATGTPEGVGVGMEPQVFLQPGDLIRCEVESIGAIENRVAKV
ncbi:fumarylacetoacetate hydrolase family protein [Sphingobium fluviale]|uniref:5-carboxymethyl-2-hydroxymuconate isomerase n=1 Tax=Sphingobium fluviale TaxID=2506423 RepID=A0A4Q1KIW9_9SPHN|nr:fumarylacetoacetate hydrolase family protein [Sphingobium fluviale]RXR29761.1 5-carboxymethyl-2-hydroxymuconate isomerase [Sphingobium fluviale]